MTAVSVRCLQPSRGHNSIWVALPQTCESGAVFSLLKEPGLPFHVLCSRPLLLSTSLFVLVDWLKTSRGLRFNVLYICRVEYFIWNHWRENWKPKFQAGVRLAVLHTKLKKKKGGNHNWYPRQGNARTTGRCVPSRPEKRGRTEGCSVLILRCLWSVLLIDCQP